MDPISTWTNGRPADVAFTAVSIASASKIFYQLVKQLRANALPVSRRADLDAENWLFLYHNHRQVGHAFRSIVKQFGAYGKTIADYLERQLKIINEAKMLNAKGKDFSQLLISEANRLNSVDMSELLKKQLEYINTDIMGPGFNDTLDYLMQNVNMVFVLSIVAPSLLLYHEYPAILLRKARIGEKDAIDKILRLDPVTLFDSKIQRHFLRFQAENNQFQYHETLKALQKPPKAKVSRQKIKVSLAGLIASMTDRNGNRLMEPDIRALFDAVAQQYYDQEIDTDLPESPESLVKAIQREKAFWDRLRKVDKK